MIRTVVFALAFVLSLIITALLLPFWYVWGWLGLKSAQKTYGYLVSHYWAKFLLLFAGVRVSVKGLENIPRQGSCLFVSNHQGNFDIPVLFSSLNTPIGFLAKIELAKIPVLRQWMPLLGCVFIDRANLRQSVKAVQQCVDVLKRGYSMVIFPEGTRSKSRQMGEFKKGSLRLVEKADVPIVPVTVNNTYSALEANNNRVAGADVSVVISPPIYYGKLSGEEQARINDIVLGAISRNLPEK